jgi:phospholipid-binding lipoprotein MlaA
VGILGFGDPAKKYYSLKPKDEDLGQTFGFYGIGNGFYIVWPFFGPSSMRDSVGMIGDIFLDPIFYVKPREASIGITSYKTVNETSFKIGDYESFKAAAIDPYEALKDAYIQNRKKKINE